MRKIGMFDQLMPSLKRGSWSSASLLKHLFGDRSYSMAELCEVMMNSDGEYSSLLLADRILNAFEQLDDAGRVEFFRLLNDTYDLDVDAVKDAIDAYEADRSAASLKRVTAASETRRQEFFRRLNLAPNGTRRLVKMREAALKVARSNPELGKMDPDFRHLFNSWFNRGFLTLTPIDWTTSAHILEKIIAYEAVHEIRNWGELRSRLEPVDRHCFAFFHPAMEDEPLVFVEVALTQEVPNKIETILDSTRTPIAAEDASCAIFYSISNCHAGLGGVSFGNFLIKQVAIELQQVFPNLKKFATISPVPGFRRWLCGLAEEDAAVNALVNEVVADPRRLHDEGLSDQLSRLAARYFLQEKGHRNAPIDPVARFHLKNGAELARLNMLADSSAKGFDHSFGMMVNYVYDLAKVEENHEQYMKAHQIVCSPQIKKLLSS